MAQFQYDRRLVPGEIRLLKLDWGKEDEDLKGRLLTRRLADDHYAKDLKGDRIDIRTTEEGESKRAEKYEALSYTWELGAGDKRIYIVVGDKGTKRHTFTIKSNLETILKILRSRIGGHDKARYLWIDAICINQTDNQEKSIQIPLMGKVYGNAENVCVWLGSSTKTSDRALDFVDKVLELDGFDELVTKEDDANLDLWGAFCELLKSRWFGRRWIVQEIAFAKTATIYCGNIEKSWDTVADAINLVSSRPESLRKLFKTSRSHDNHPDLLGDLEKMGASWLASTLEALFRKTEDGEITQHMFSLEALISNLTLFEAGDPRDTLYAIMWLANDVLSDGDVLTRHVEVDQSRPATPTFEMTDSSLQEDVSQLGAQYGEDPDAAQLTRTETEREEEEEDVPAVDEAEGQPRPVAAIPRRTDHTRMPSIELTPIADLPRTRSRLFDGESSLTAPNKPYRKPAPIGVPGAASEGASQSDNISYSGAELTIVISYDKAIYEVCKDFMAHVFSRYGNIDMMCRPWAPDPSEKHPWNPPSWMVTLNRNVAFALDGKGFYRRVNADPLVGFPQMKSRRPYNASGARRAFGKQIKGKRYCWPPSIGEKANLKLKGFVLAEVSQFSDAASDGNIPVKWLELADWQPKSGEPIPYEFWRTLVGDRGLDETSEPPRYFRLAAQYAFRKDMGNINMKTNDILVYGNCPSHVAEFLRRVQRVTWNRRLLHATIPEAPKEQPLLGLGPHDTRRGDKICILYGCSVPVLLREENADTLRQELQLSSVRRKRKRDVETRRDTPPQEERPLLKNGFPVSEDETWWRFVGECYVHNMMNGEVFDHKKKYHPGDKVGETEFEIR